MKGLISLKSIGRGLRRFFALRPRITHPSLIRLSLLVTIIVLALGLRMLPLRWGLYLSEFDPYFHYYTAKYIANNGLSSFFLWHDWSGWWPNGRYMPSLANLGLSLSAISIFRILSIFGVPMISSPNPLDPLSSDPLFNVCIVFPILATIMTCITMYFLGKSVGGELVGLFSALLLALDPSYISRTSLGWFDDETIGILSALLTLLFFSRAIDENRCRKDSLIYSILAGLSLGCLCISWGAARYIIGILALFTIVLLLLRRYSPRLLSSYIITFLIATSISISSPRLDLGFLTENFMLMVYGALILLLVAEGLRREKSMKGRALYILAFIIVLVSAFSFLTLTGILREPERKFIYAIFPHLRAESPLFESVAEHRPSGWATFYNNFGVSLIFVPIGVFFATLAATNLNILIVLYCLTSLYFASSMIRLLILASPAVCLLCALALKKISFPIILSSRESAKRKMKVKFFGREVIGGLLALFLILFVFTYVFGTTFIVGQRIFMPMTLSYADAPVTIAGASLSVRPSTTVRDWIDTLTWMRINLPSSPSKPGESGTVIASWWDYGYWITVFSNKTTLADNGTLNGTQIAQIGKMFMSSEEEAIKILKQYNATHVVVFVTFPLEMARWLPEYALHYGSAYGGDNGKWRWMARIAGLDDNVFGNATIGWDFVDKNKNGRLDYGELVPNELGQNATLYKLMMYGIEATVLGSSGIELIRFKKAFFSREYPIQSAPETGGIIPLVCLYEVIYD
ncbi:MAG: STT3 domain-containing protein [Candidatus Bathyarchaeia archaeon]|nr:glycosyltransferase family 39 protein [Candidatus Bathyarchaeota archaeon]